MNQPNTTIECLQNQANLRPTAIAFEVGGESITYSALLADVLLLAGALQFRGLCHGERCALLLGTNGDFLRAILAVQMLGAIPVAINTALPPEAILRRLALVRPSLSLAASDTKIPGDLPSKTEVVSELMSGPKRLLDIAPVQTDAIAYLQITSGTTGEPKAAAITHRNLMVCLRGAGARIGFGPDSVLVGWVPLHHDLGLVRFVFGSLHDGACTHLLPPTLASIGEWLRTMTRVHATYTASPDFGYRVATRTVKSDGIDLSTLRYASNGGEAVRLSTITDFEQRFGCAGAIRPGYGLAEATLGVSGLPPGEPLRSDASGSASTGPAFNGIEIRVIGADGAFLEAGNTGSIEVRGEAVFNGYFGDEETTRDVLGEDGWMKTGDTGALDVDGHLYVHGRTRAMIKRAGALIAPFEVEQATDQIPGVRLSAAVGMISNEYSYTEDVMLVVELRPEDSSTAAAQQKIVRQINDAVTKAIGFPPGKVMLVPPRTIPLTANGKIRHAILKDQLVTEGVPTIPSGGEPQRSHKD